MEIAKQGFSIEAKDVKFSKKRQHNAVIENEKSAAKEQCNTTTNHIFLDKKVLYFASQSNANFAENIVI